MESLALYLALTLLFISPSIVFIQYLLSAITSRPSNPSSIPIIPPLPLL